MTAVCLDYFPVLHAASEVDGMAVEWLIGAWPMWCDPGPSLQQMTKRTCPFSGLSFGPGFPVRRLAVQPLSALLGKVVEMNNTA